MDAVVTFRGWRATEEDLAEIRSLLARNPTASRRRISALLCEEKNWRQPNGALRDMACRSFLLALHRAGHIELPPIRKRPPNNAIVRRKPQAVLVDRTPLAVSLPELGALEIAQVRRTGDERLMDALLEEHHYLAYGRPVGETLKYLVWARDRPIACLTWSSAPRHLAPRDRFIGWSPLARRRNVRYIAYNTRFLILPWVVVPHLASHLLGKVARRISADWEALYSHPVFYLETFVDPERFRGTSYLAANWTPLGLTTGRGHNDRTKRPNRSLKQVLGYPLTKRFREELSTR